MQKASPKDLLKAAESWLMAGDLDQGAQFVREAMTAFESEPDALVAAIRGRQPVGLTDFPTGLRYMRFTQAVAEAAATGSTVALPPQDEAG